MPIFLVLAATGVLLVWGMASLRQQPAEHAPAPGSAQIEMLHELARTKHATAAEYTAYADIAEEEMQAHAARLFRALARAELVHEITCADAVRRLGGTYHPPRKVTIFNGHTTANIDNAYHTKLRNYDHHYRSGKIERALEADNYYAARVLIRTAGGDMRQIGLLEHFATSPGNGYAVCPLCGNICRADRCEHYCPFCHTSEAQFFRFE